MGQQQLLLLVLGIVIVGLATVVGIEVFSSARQSTGVDRAAAEAAQTATAAIAWKNAPCMLGGGKCHRDFIPFEFQGFGVTDVHPWNAFYYDAGSMYKGVAMKGLANGALRVEAIDVSSQSTARFFVYGPSEECWALQTGTWTSSASITPATFWQGGNWSLTPSTTPPNPDDTACSWS